MYVGPRPVLIGLVLACAVGMLAACGDEAPPAPAARFNRARPAIVASTEPLRWVATRLAGDWIDATIGLPEGADPAHWIPTPERVRSFQDADLALLNGAWFELWLETASLPRSTTIVTAKAVRSPLIERPGAIAHTHGDGTSHVHGKIDGHTWVDPQTLLEQAAPVRDGLIRLLPQHKTAIETRFAALRTELMALHDGFAALAAPAADEVVVAAQGVYDYLARRHGWTMHNLDLQADVALDKSALAEIEAALAGRKAKWIFWDREPTADSAAALRTLGLESLVLAPGERLHAAQIAAGEDYLTIARANLATLERAWGKRGSD